MASDDDSDEAATEGEEEPDREASDRPESEGGGLDELRPVTSIDPEGVREAAKPPAEDPSSSDSEGADARPEGERSESSEPASEAPAGPIDRDRDETVDDSEASTRAVTHPIAEDHTTIDAATALEGTHLFVRYGDTQGPTLEDAVAGRAEREAYVDNLAIERHTTFPSEATWVDGRPYREFAEDALALRTGRWLVADLPFALSRTRRTNLSGLLDELPAIDRIDFVEPVEGHTFDLVARDRSGAPRIVAAVDDDRDATGAARLDRLIEGTGEAVRSGAAVAGALLVTRSFFDPAVYDRAESAAKRGLLRRGTTGYVRLSRTTGYHLALVEYRTETAHVVSPEL